jgi:biopolymer transport protein ExbB
MRSMLESYTDGGPIMHVIALVAALGLIVLIERFYVIVVKSKNNGRLFIEQVIQMVRSGKIEDAIKVCANSSATLPDVGLLILRSRSRDETDLQNVAAAALLLVMPKLTRRLQYLRSLAIVVFLLGLLATTLRARVALEAFTTPGQTGFSLLASSLVPTTFALGVAAALTLGRAYLVSQSESISEDTREFAARLINALLDRPDVRLGHRG